MFTQEFI